MGLKKVKITHIPDRAMITVVVTEVRTMARVGMKMNGLKSRSMTPTSQ